jgi:hypothetical protein
MVNNSTNVYNKINNQILHQTTKCKKKAQQMALASVYSVLASVYSVYFVIDIGGIVDHYCLSFILLLTLVELLTITV